MRTFERVLVDVDPHAVHHPALERGVTIAHATGAELVVVAVTTGHGHPSWSSVPSDDPAPRRLRDRLEMVAAGADATVSTKLLFGSPAAALAEEAQRCKADLVIRSHARDMVLPSQYGAVDRELIRSSPVPVLLVGPGGASERPRVLAAIAPDTGFRDTATLNRTVVEYALSMAAIEEGVPVLLQAFKPLVLHVTHDLDVETQDVVEQRRTEVIADLNRMVRDLGEDPRDVEVNANLGSIDHVLPDFIVSRGIDLVVIGVSGRRGLARWIFGNSAERLLPRLPCSVLAVKLDRLSSRARIPLSGRG